MARKYFVGPALVGSAVAAGLMLMFQADWPGRTPQGDTKPAASVQPQAASTTSKTALPGSRDDGPASAIFAWGPQEYAEAVPVGLVPAHTAADALAVYRRNAINGRVHAGLQPEVHLWLYTGEPAGITKQLAWVLFFRNVEQPPIGVPKGFSPAPEVAYTGCLESYVVDATSGRGLANSVQCPDPQ